MEAVPRLPMLKLEHKACIDQPVFSIALKKYIREHYNEDPSSYTSEIQELEQLRSSITFARRDFEYCNSLRKYFCQLRFLLSRFPISQPETDSLNITFYWKDLYSATVHEVADIRYEQASILYNIAVYHMTEGAAENRSTPDGMKISCTHFQCAAWAFQHLRENFLQSSDCDLSPQLMSLLHTIALAQAQECILEKSISDNRKPNIIARVAMQVVEYLSGVVRVLESKSSPVHDIIGSRRVKTWLRYCQLKQVYYHSVTQLYLGLQAEELQKMGERLAFFKDANSRLAAAAKLAKNMDDEEAIRECLNFSHDVMGGKLSAAQKENEFVFHEKVPDISSLPEVKGASLVKEIPFSMTDPDISGPDIFRNLIPIEAHQASSLYSEEKASLLRSLGARLQEKNDELEAFLASLQLEDLLLDEDPDALPQELVSACADMNARDALRELTEVMQKVSSAHLTIADMLDRQEALLEEEDNRAAEFRTIVGDKKAPTNVLSELRREGDKCRSALMAANDSNVALHAAVVQHRPTLTTLSQPLQRVASSLPSVAAAITQQSGESGKEAKLQIERLMKKVEEMQQQRWSVEKQLRQNLMEDDITGTLVTADADMADIFKEHLQKHNKELEILEKNMLAQNNILKALSEANAAYASTRRAMKQTMAARQAAVAALVQAHASFTSILDKAKDANLFYEKLNTQVTKLLKRTESLLSVQEEERTSRLKAQAKKFSSTRPQAAAISHAPSAKNAINFPTHAPHAPIQGGDDLASYAGSGPKLKDVLMASGGYKGLGSTVLPGQPSPQHGGSAFSPASTGYRVDVSSAAALAAMASATTAAASSNTGHTSMGATPSNIRDSGYSNENQVAAQSSYLQSSSQVPGAHFQTPAYSSQVPGGYSQPSAAVSYGSSVGYPCYPPSAPSPAPQLPSSHFLAAVSTTGNTPVLTSYQSSQYAAAAAQHAAAAGAPSYTSPATTEYFASNYTTDPSLSSKPTTATHPCATVPSAATYQASSGPNTYHTQANSSYLASSIASPYYSASAYGQQVGANLAAASIQVTPVTASGQHPQTNSIPSSITNEVAAASGTIPIATSGSHIPAQGYYYNQPYASGFTQPHVTSSSVTGQQFPANATTPYASETRASVPFTTSQVYPAPTTTLAQSNPINVTGNQSSLPTNLAYPAAMASYATPQPNVSTVASSSSAIPSMNYGSDGKNLAAAGQTSYPGFAPGSSTSQLQPPYGSSALQYQSGSYQAEHAYHTPQHLISPFTPNQYPSGSGTYTPSMSIASSLKSSVPYHVQSNTYYSTTASATSSGTTVVNSSDAIDGRSPYRHASATPAVPSYFYACAGAGAPSSMTPSSTGSPLPSAGFGVKENGVAGTSTTQPYPAYPAYASHQYSAGVYPVQQQQMNYPGQTLYSQTSQLPSGPSQTSQQAPLPAVTKPSDAAPASKGISNLDLLSGIELAGPSSMWTPLTPKRSQDTVTENSTSSSVVTTDATVPITSVESEVSSSAKEGCHSSVTDDAESSVSKTDAISNAESVSVNGSAEKVPDKGCTDAISTSKETISISTAALNMAALAQSKKAAPPQDPLDDAGTLAALTSDTERLHKTVETLERRSLNGPTNLEVKWREIQEAVEARCKKSTVSVSRCYPLKNRFPDILPYDHSRVVLTDAYDDYINASHVQLRGSHSFPVVVSQAPTPATAADYWLMVWQLQTELIVCLHTLPEIKNASYWPESRGTQQYGDMSVREHNSGEGGGGAWVQRLFHLTRTSNSGSSSSTRAVIHLQFLRWPPGGMPSHPSPVLQLCSEALSLHRQQRVRQRPVLYTCVPGVGRSCVAALLTVFLNHLHSAGSVCDLQSLCEDACVARRGGLQDKDYLAFLYSAALYAAQELLMKRGILTNKATFDEGPIEKGHRQHVRHPSADLLAANCDFNRLKSKLGLGETEDKVGNPTTDQENDAASNGNGATTEKNETSRPKSASPALSIPSMVGVSLPPNLAASLDPQQLKIEPVAPGKGAKITKESFERPPQAGLAGRAQDPDDPLSSLDPLWTLKKSE
ncbi:tyrosine-protein phosphatase non-receptor type 23 isoform X2 [Hyalella azteca]|uniref:Tyrosine-protein phosphatase non-receptor type 23 isoform X2 n=1 Tax=Hyalella azteca TaxID=294128 RepID=A0A979FJE2_HYAAZ|nr:tyrosine-protein phosphatase non-receptor type 23 isoform X2 [Hyalella azteca]